MSFNSIKSSDKLQLKLYLKSFKETSKFISVILLIHVFSSQIVLSLSADNPSIDIENNNNNNNDYYYNNNRPPRGYCKKISEAIGKNSRCYGHLIESKSKLFKKVIDENKNKVNNINYNKNKGDEHLNEIHFEKRTKKEEVDEEEEQNDLEELVYVRLETFGSTIGNLKTIPINEKLLVGVLTKLLGINDNEIQSMKKFHDYKGNNNNNKMKKQLDKVASQDEKRGGEKNTYSMRDNLRAQILEGNSFDLNSNTDFNINSLEESSRLAYKCRLSIEKFLCRIIYPVCHFRQKDVSALVRPPCKEDCLLLRDVLCSNLDWSQFITVLNQAFNETLLSVINVLDLEVEGDLKVEKKDLQNNVRKNVDVENEEVLSKKKLNEIDDESNSKTLANNSSLSTKLNSSIHFYWPHEHSIDKCELLPSFRSIENFSQTFFYDNNNNNNNNKNNIHNHHHHHHLNHKTGYYHNNNRTYNLNRRKRFYLNFNSKLSKKWPICSNAHLTSIFSIERDNIVKNNIKKECLESIDGIEYKGGRNFTKSGRICQRWQNKWPHSHKYSELLFNNMENAHNYCRNPGGIELKPWCYTMDKNVRWEYCEIDNCSS